MLVEDRGFIAFLPVSRGNIDQQGDADDVVQLGYHALNWVHLSEQCADRPELLELKVRSYSSSKGTGYSLLTLVVSNMLKGSTSSLCWMLRDLFSKYHKAPLFDPFDLNDDHEVITFAIKDVYSRDIFEESNAIVDLFRDKPTAVVHSNCCLYYTSFLLGDDKTHIVKVLPTEVDIVGEHVFSTVCFDCGLLENPDWEGHVISRDQLSTYLNAMSVHGYNFTSSKGSTVPSMILHNQHDKVAHTPNKTNISSFLNNAFVDFYMYHDATTRSIYTKNEQGDVVAINYNTFNNYTDFVITCSCLIADGLSELRKRVEIPAQFLYPHALALIDPYLEDAYYSNYIRSKFLITACNSKVFIATKDSYKSLLKDIVRNHRQELVILDDFKTAYKCIYGSDNKKVIYVMRCELRELQGNLSMVAEVYYIGSDLYYNTFFAEEGYRDRVMLSSTIYNVQEWITLGYLDYLKETFSALYLSDVNTFSDK